MNIESDPILIPGEHPGGDVLINLSLVLLHAQLYRTCVMIMTDADIQCKQLQCTKLIIKIVPPLQMIFKIIVFIYDY